MQYMLLIFGDATAYAALPALEQQALFADYGKFTQDIVISSGLGTREKASRYSSRIFSSFGRDLSVARRPALPLVLVSLP